MEAKRTNPDASHEVTKSQQAALQDSWSAARGQRTLGPVGRTGRAQRPCRLGKAWVVGGKESRMQVIADAFSADTEQYVMLSVRLGSQDLALSLPLSWQGQGPW